ncbi:C2 domain-containing protein [Entamoeba marina]
METQITIIAAKGIRAADIGGTSDGYVKFETKQTKKMKTKIAKPSLNPVWNETFKAKVTPGEVIVFEVFDHDPKFTVPQLNAGETYYDVLPISVQGYLYVSITLPSGGGQSYHHMDPKAEVVLKIDLKKLVNVIKPKNTVVQSATINLSTSLTKEQETGCIDHLIMNDFHDSICLKGKVGEKITVRVMNAARLLLSSKVYDTGSWVIPDLVDKELVCERIPLKKGGVVFANVTCLRGVYHNVFSNEIPNPRNNPSDTICKYELTVIRANDIIAADSSGTSDAYVKILTSNSKEKKTFVCYPTLNPQWNHAFRIKAKAGSEVLFKLYDKDLITKDDHLGDASFTIPTEFKENDLRSFQLAINKKGKLIVELKKIRTISPAYKAASNGTSGSSDHHSQSGHSHGNVGYPPQGYGYPPQQGGYPPQGYGYPPQGYGYPQQQGGYPQGYGYPPQGYGYPQQNYGYPPQQGGYPPQGYNYPPKQGQQPPQQGGYPPQQGQQPAQQEQKSQEQKPTQASGCTYSYSTQN